MTSAALSPQEQKWVDQVQVLMDFQNEIKKEKELTHTYIFQIAHTAEKIKKPSHAFYATFEERLPGLLNAYGTAHRTTHTNLGFMVKNVSQKKDLTAFPLANILIAYGAGLMENETQRDPEIASAYVESGMEIKYGFFGYYAQNGLNNTEAKFLSRLFIHDHESTSDSAKRLLNKYLKKPQVARDIADAAVKHVDRTTTINHEYEPNYINFPLLTKALDLGSSDNQKAATTTFNFILASAVSNQKEADTQFSFVEEAMQKGWLSREQVTTGLHEKMTHWQEIDLQAERHFMLETDRSNYNHTGVATLFYLASLEPEALLTYQDFVVKSSKLPPNHGSYSQLFDRLAPLKNDQLSADTEKPVWNAQRTSDDIANMRKYASDLLINFVELQPKPPQHLVIEALALNPENEKALNFVDTHIDEEPGRYASALMHLVNNGKMTEAVGIGIIKAHGLNDVVDYYQQNKEQKESRQKNFEKARVVFE